MSRFSRTAQALAALTLSAGSLGAANAAAIFSTTYFVTADCTDCAAALQGASYQVLAEITVRGEFAPNKVLDSGSFLSFVYRGSNLLQAFSITATGNDNDASTTDFVVGGVSGSLPGALPGGLQLGLTTTLGGGRYVSFSSNGDWSMCMSNACSVPTATTLPNDDFGTQAALSSTPPAANDVPEPGSLALSALALLGLGAAYRSRRS